MRDDKIDHCALELDYRAGVLPVTAIANKFGVKTAYIRATAQKYGWERKPLDPLTVKAAHGMAASPPVFGMDSNLSPPDLERAAIISAASIIATHRKDVARLREMSSKFSDHLISIFEAAASGDPDKLSSVLQSLRILNGDKTPADLLEQLSRVMVRLVNIERQAYGLDVNPNPDPESPQAEQVRSEVDKLWQQIQQIQKEKTVH